MAFTEFCCRSGGSNLNAGTRTGNSTEPGTAADLTYASGSWVASTGVFTVASGDPVADGVAVGDFASVYADGSTVTGFVGRVTARTTTTITVSLTAKAGTAPADGTNTRTVKIGGAWKGPNGAEAFPFGFITNGPTNSSGDYPRVNLKNDATYNVTAGINHTSAHCWFEGYSSSYGDRGRATIDGGTAGASYVLVTLNPGTSQYGKFGHFILQNNGATGNANGLVVTVGGGDDRGFVEDVVVHDVRGMGFIGNCSFMECEAYNCNQSNTATTGGFNVLTAVNCISHDNTGSNNSGFILSATGATCHGCIADSNGKYGFYYTNQRNSTFVNCDAYNNGSDGLFSDGAAIQVFNCNLIKNGGYGINFTTLQRGRIANCGFGSGTQANTSGQTPTASTGTTQMEIIGSITYAADVTPWVDPANGDFRINLATAKGTGRGAFTQTAASYAGTVAYPDVGAGQHLDVGGGLLLNSGMQGGLRG